MARHFEWSTSHSRVRFPDFIHYDYRGAFGHFASYSVETRDRVRCISAQYGVPLSTQWSTVPYFYPIQIAQYALQHYSRFKNAPSSIAFLKGATAEEWHDNTLGGNGFKLDFDGKANSTKIQINATDHGVSLSLDGDPTFSILSFFWLADVDESKIIRLHYIHSDNNQCVWRDKQASKSDYNYSLGTKPNPNEWRWICRDLLVDAGRALASTSSKKDTILLHPGILLLVYLCDVILDSITFRGHSIIRDLKQRSSAYLEHFLIAADWLANNQDEYGGWSVPVERSIADKRLILPAGWHSAMAQGHALSVLTRAYVVTNDAKYLQIAKRALRLFKTVRSRKGGVLNELLVIRGLKNTQRHQAHLCLMGYHSVHIYLLKWLYIITKDEFLNETANRWASYATGHRVKHN
ncbi:D-glucuronyl C5-epimerase [Dirofilaria immitis]|nr:D-glucuronyl C5-epimerase [Dirofilaria immitis]